MTLDDYVSKLVDKLRDVKLDYGRQCSRADAKLMTSIAAAHEAEHRGEMREKPYEAEAGKQVRRLAAEIPNDDSIPPDDSHERWLQGIRDGANL